VLVEAGAPDHVLDVIQPGRTIGGMTSHADVSLADGLSKLPAALAAEPCPEQVDQVWDTQIYLPMLRQRLALVESVATGAG
jgi:hypothetical protein